MAPPTAPTRMLAARMNPPAWLLLPMARPWQLRPVRASLVAGMVNAPFRMKLRRIETSPRLAANHHAGRIREKKLRHDIFMSDRAAFADASELLDRFGEFAALEASQRASRSRDFGFVV